MMNIKGSSTIQARFAVAATAVSVALFSGCLSPEQPKAVGAGGAATGLPAGSGSSGPSFGSGTGTGSDPAIAFKNSKATKVIFNKSNFFSNANPNPNGCAGDARYYFDPLTDRKVPARPNWLKNVAVEITNSNAKGGSSRALSCALSAVGTANAANCAAFDDLQPLDGTQSRSVLIGGYGCAAGISGCSPTSLTKDIWNLVVPDASTASAWSQQAVGIPSGLAWPGGDYDEIHDMFFTYGGVTPSSGNPSNAVFSDQLNRIYFNPDQTTSTNPKPTALDGNGSSSSSLALRRRNYAGWATSSFDVQLMAQNIVPPPPLVGSTFTYGLRREPSMSSRCRKGDTIPFFGPTNTCSGSVTGTNITAVSANEYEDYFLLFGGMLKTGVFSKNIYAYKPHGFSNDIGTAVGVTPLATDGDWMVMSNIVDQITGQTLPGVSRKVMKVVDIGAGPNSSTPYIGTDVGAVRQAGDTFSGWLGRAYHKTVYDPGMNRFYLFGGVENKNAATISPTPAIGVAPDLAATDVWIYDPPSLNRRPTSLCYTDEMPNAIALPKKGFPINNGIMGGVQSNLGPTVSYLQNSFVFPPGGCLQRIKLDNQTQPTGRFGHGQVFDRENKLMYVFGGCNSPSPIQGDNTPRAGDPTLGCGSSALLNDLWVYVPPSTTEIVPKSYRTSNSVTSPFNALTLFANVFGTDFWLDHLPLFNQYDDPNSGALSAPESWRVLGRWIQLLPSGEPTIIPPRVGAGITFDRAHRKIYVQGGFGCTEVTCSQSPRALNDLWEYTPPNFETECPDFRSTGVCSTSSASTLGTWRLLRPSVDASNTDQPTLRYGGVMSYAYNQFSYGDEFYMVTDSACQFQGPIATNDASVNKQLVGAIYVDLNRDGFGSAENLLINLRFLPFDKKTRLPAVFDNNTPGTAVDDTDQAGSADVALIRVQLISNPMKFADQIQSTVQPRYHEFISGSPILGDTFMYVSGATGQITEKQLHIPISIDPSINMIKIERISGTVKFFEMTVSKF